MVSYNKTQQNLNKMTRNSIRRKRRSILVGRRSAWIFFCCDNRDKLSKEYKQFKEINRQLAKQWSELPSNEKEKYIEMELNDRHRFEKDKINLSSDDLKSLKSLNKSRKKLFPTKSRKVSPYMFFVKHSRKGIVESNSKLTFKEISQEISRQWKSLSNSEKQVYIDMSNESSIAVNTHNVS